ncbi:Cytochrome c5 [BD1-7 clade bacterium]|uniref:Cytochrome c5 n=1 Tax=BD1-7 clade bacterium TaxID=2029982 RepID=A0A5S9PJY8_9GAMM|nr:Cytochrome c5 [BD1-7 clade bacterium]CAA0104019.1 Cytochrome c5 [BD1-7 clade bacterium]
MQYHSVLKALLPYLLLSTPLISSLLQAQALDDSVAATYQRYCAQCHNAKIDGAPRPHNVGDWAVRVEQKTDAQLLHSVKRGLGSMPAGGSCANCSDQTLNAVIAWMKPHPGDVKQIADKPDLVKNLQRLNMPTGFQISVYADDIEEPRGMALGDDGIVYVGSRKAGKVYAVLPATEDHVERQVKVIARGLHMPHGVVFSDGDLYVAEVSQIIRFRGIDPLRGKIPAAEVVYGGMPKVNHHGWKTLHLGPDDKLYFPVGMPCNTCDYRSSQPLFGSIVRMTKDGKDVEFIAKGIRHSVGFGFHPQTGVMWFSDNGQDFMGDNLPPDELNRLSQEGLDFGFPYFYGNNIPSPGYDRPPKGVTPPVFELPAHVAPLGVHFYRGSMFPKSYRNKLLIAEHGSWNRTSKVGYRISTLNIKNEKASDYKPLINGWLQGESAWGRPVAFLELPDGSLLISDDKADVIYQLRYSPPRADPSL